MKADISIREAVGAADLDAARNLLREYAAHLLSTVGEEHICLERYEQELVTLPAPYGAPDGSLLLAWVDGAVAGCVAVKPLSAARCATPGERACEMKRLWVSPSRRGLGLGLRLAQAVLERAGRLGYNAMYLDTMPGTMREANAIYSRLGFEPTSSYEDGSGVRRASGCEDNTSAGVVFFRRDIAGIGSVR